MLGSSLTADLPSEIRPAPTPPWRKIVVLDDDPTGTQTVHDVRVLTTWDTQALGDALSEPGNCFYILTNSRALPVDQAVALNREIGRNLAQAAARLNQEFTVVSRGDSTLRGHYPRETDALMEALGGGFDGTLLVPAFFAGGRFTLNDVHYVANGEHWIPVGQTEFARDHAFGFRSSNLRHWVHEKTNGSVRAEAVRSITLQDLRVGGARAVAAKLREVRGGTVAIVNAVAPGDLLMLAQALREVEAEGRRYLFRTAADFVAAYAAITPRPLLTPAELKNSSAGGGLLVAGSYVGKTTAQLDVLFARVPILTRVEVAVSRLLALATRPDEVIRCIEAVDAGLAAGNHVVLYTSRQLVTAQDTGHSLQIGETVSSSLVEIVRGLSTRPGWLVAKGGITSSDTATKALGIRRAMVLGQALPGVPVWRAGAESKWPGMAYVIFPGNVGGPDAVAQLVGALVA